MRKKLGIITGVVILLVMMISFISAFGASTAYWSDRPLKLAPGESKTVSLGLQNGGGGTEDITLRAELTNDGGGIATLVDEDLDYFVPVGRGAGVPIRIEVPEDAETGITHQITVLFTQVASGEGGMVRLAGGIVSKFPVEVVGEKESVLYTLPEVKKGLSGFWIVIIALVVALIIFAAVKKKKN